MAKSENIDFVQDKKGVVWDLLLYVPTVIALALIAANFWYSGEQAWAYMLVFLASYFFIVGANRVALRLLLLPSAPLSMCVAKTGVVLKLKSGEKVELVKELRFFGDYAGKSFGLTGFDLEGKKRQFVLHKGQLANEVEFKSVCDSLRVFA